MTDWLLPFLCGLGAAVISAWGVGGGTLLLSGDDTVSRRGPANGPGHQPAVLPAHSHFRPAVPLAVAG
ncbi:MAG: hypothetical protein ACLU38_08090 [Dysosmobacter sp.]